MKGALALAEFEQKIPTLLTNRLKKNQESQLGLELDKSQQWLKLSENVCKKNLKKFGSFSTEMFVNKFIAYKGQRLLYCKLIE